jgi:gas vesicle protein
MGEIMRERLSGFLLGIGAGIGIGILFAPKSGQQTRELLRVKAEDGEDYLVQRGHELRDNAADLINRGKEAISRQKSTLADAVEAGKQAYHEKVGGTASSAGPISS